MSVREKRAQQGYDAQVCTKPRNVLGRVCGLELGMDLADIVVMHVNEVQSRHLCMVRLPQFRGMEDPKALPAAKVKHLCWRLLPEVVESWRFDRCQLTEQFVRLEIAKPGELQLSKDQ